MNDVMKVLFYLKNSCICGILCYDYFKLSDWSDHNGKYIVGCWWKSR